MDDLRNSPEFLAFVRDFVPSLEAAAVLVCIAAEPERDWAMEEVAAELRNSISITRDEIARLIESLAERGLLEHRLEARVRLGRERLPAENLRKLVHAYERKPVTLVQLIYAMRKEKIRLFSEAFRIKKD